MKNIPVIIFIICLLTGFSGKQFPGKKDFVIADGQMPNLVKDRNNNLHLTYGRGDSIFYAFSSNNGYSFSPPTLVTVLPGVFTYAMRGPQIAATDSDLMMIAVTSAGDIFSFFINKNGNWSAGARVNDADTIAKEGLIALSANANTGYAVWLDLRGDNKNKIYGARTMDGGKTWSKNILIYSSPDSSVCECCKPSVVVRGKNVYVMFRNWLKGNRDLYLVQSSDYGTSFREAQKLGKGSWKLNGCPMDGGAIALNNETPETVWQRNGSIFAASPGATEKLIGKGRGCTIEIVNGKKVYAWRDNGDIVILKPTGQKEILGKGSLPILKAINSNHVICVWENEKQVHAAIVDWP